MGSTLMPRQQQFEHADPPSWNVSLPAKVGYAMQVTQRFPLLTQSLPRCGIVSRLPDLGCSVGL
jgi:hypothetical protein